MKEENKLKLRVSVAPVFSSGTLDKGMACRKRIGQLNVIRSVISTKSTILKCLVTFLSKMGNVFLLPSFPNRQKSTTMSVKISHYGYNYCHYH